MNIISDSTALIHLSKIGRISLLKKLFNNILIEKEIYSEIVEKEYGEVAIIENLIEEGFIIIKKASKKIYMPNLDEGEKLSLSLCKELNIENILIDEHDGFNIAIMLNLKPIRTTTILLILLDKKLINIKEYEKSLLDLSRSGYFMSTEIYQRLLTAGKNIGK